MTSAASSGPSCAVQEVELRISGRLTHVFVHHPAQTIPAQYRSGLSSPDRCPLLRRALPQALVRPDLSVVLDELSQHVLQVAAPEDQQMVESLASYCSDPSFGK